MTSLKMRSSLLRLAIAAGLALSAATASADFVAKLPQVMNPFFLTIADGRMYVVEDSVAVHVFRLDAKGVSFVKTFGRKGQGPGEFDYIYTVRPFKDHLDVPGTAKIARFSLDGDYVGEVAVTANAFKGGVYRLGDVFVVKGYDFDGTRTVTTIRIYDKNSKLVKEIGNRTEPANIQKINVAAEYYSPRVAGEQLYVIDSGQESFVTVYDRNGVELKKIRLPLEPLKMTAALKEAIIKPLKEGWTGPTPWADFEKRLFFPARTPGLDYFEVLEGKFVTRTYKYTQDKVEFALFDEQGRELRRLNLPFTGRPSNGILFCFYQGRFFYLHENPQAEAWELHSEKAW